MALKSLRDFYTTALNFLSLPGAGMLALETRTRRTEDPAAAHSDAY